MKHRIWLDCDGVLCDFVSGYLDLLNMEILTSGSEEPMVQRSDVKRWELETLSTRRKAEAVWRKIDMYPSWVDRLREEPGSSVALQYLRSRWSVGCLTTPVLTGTWMYQRARWLIARGFDKKDIIFAKEKHFVRGAVLVDDKPENCMQWQNKNPAGLAILFSQPWNQGAFDIVRCEGWVETVETIKRWLTIGLK